MDRIAHISRIILPIYWAILSYILLRPGIKETKLSLFPHIDKVVHFIAFFILGFLLKNTFQKKIHFSQYIIIISLYGAITEILQETMQLGRSLELIDLLADILGGIFSFIFHSKIGKHLSKSN